MLNEGLLFKFKWISIFEVPSLKFILEFKKQLKKNSICSSNYENSLVTSADWLLK